MKHIPLFLKVLFSTMLLGLLVVACQKDSLEVAPEPEAEYVLPAEFDGIFTEAELAEFYAGPTDAMRKQVRDRFGVWHRITMLYTGQQLMLPFVDDCYAPTPCTTCYDPSQWLGLVINGQGPGTLFGQGSVQVGVDAVNCFSEGFLEFVGWMDYNGNKTFGNLTNLSTVQGRDGSVVEILRGDVFHGTGMFEGAEGYLLHRVYSNSLLQPFQPRTYTGYSIGWMYY